MDIDCIPFRQTGYFSDLICDYLDEKEALKPFYGHYPNLDGFERQLISKAREYPQERREVLYDALEGQYEGLRRTKKVGDHLKQLKEPITFTIVTGHQLNLFTGPLYFLYKIIATIKLTRELKEAFPKYNFVPIYWMATEDHDFEEINHFNFKGQKIRWNSTDEGAVGRMATEGLDEVYSVFTKALGEGERADRLKELFKKAYLEQETLTKATRYLVHELFGDYGLVIVDGDDARLKKELVPYAERDIMEQLSFKNVSKTVGRLTEMDQGYDIQVNPREINYFYLREGLRERIVERGGRYYVLETDRSFSAEELREELRSSPERFSPNVIARPLYQEIILPNLCYIGGGGEIAYWLELKSMFAAMGVAMPILLVRNSALLITGKQHRKLEKLQVTEADLFMKQSSLINKKIREISNIDIDFSPQKALLEEQFKSLYDLAEKTDASFLGAVKAQEVKQKKGLDTLEKRLLKAQKRKLEDHVERMTALQNALFPNQSLQERHLNFSEIYLELGDDLLPTLYEHLSPLRQGFAIIRL